VGLLAGCIGIGATFFKAGLLKYQSWEFTVRLFEDEYRVPLLDPAVAARIAMVQELTGPDSPLPRARDAYGNPPTAWHDRLYPDFRLSERLQRASGLGIDSAPSSRAGPASSLSTISSTDTWADEPE
jgi:hypothetical protein